MKLDLHIHTCYSQDGSNKPKEFAKTLKQKGFQGMAVTDHNTIRGGLKAMESATQDFLVIPGIEISTSHGHLIALGVTEHIKAGLHPEETIEVIHEKGGIVVIPHPYRLVTGIKHYFPGAEAIETFNARCSYWSNARAAKLATKLNTGRTGGSDGHTLSDAGTGYTLVENGETMEDVLAEIQKGNTRGEGTPMIPFKYAIYSAVAYAKRGFTRI
jgi:predicted metal-dependent phosphoesterase TrpH